MSPVHNTGAYLVERRVEFTVDQVDGTTETAWVPETMRQLYCELPERGSNERVRWVDEGEWRALARMGVVSAREDLHV